MKKVLTNIFLSFSIVIAFTACNKNELDPTFKSEARLSLTANETDGARADSIAFAFSVWATSLKDTTIIIYAQTMGNLSDKDRSFNIEIDNSSTALPEEYEIPRNFVIPAGGFKVAIPIKIKRTARLSDATAKLKINVGSNENFTPGPDVWTGQVITGGDFSIVWTDQLIKPVFWDQTGTGMIWTVGKWSKVKHRLIIDASGVTNFEGITTTKKYYIATETRNALLEYNAQHPGNPLKNESGFVINICSQCD